MARHRTRLKICGITRLEDALAASMLGVDAVGFVFYDRSPRYIDPQDAAAIVRQLPPFVSAVGLFVNPDQEWIAEVLHYCPLGVIQLHGDESPEFCASQRRRVLKAIAVREADDLKRIAHYNCPVLLDAPAPAGVYGGTGSRFDWSLLANHPLEHDHPLMLAGGVAPENVAAALAIRPWFALDVSSSVERAPGIKDQAKLTALVRALQQAERP
ncbi:MAG: phosphoribosylanthranilate isomerase [Mariprofundales bacterium]|nr:phosphoribosylanthranilate isomerase [Mariprofundales bacterium]